MAGPWEQYSPQPDPTPTTAPAAAPSTVPDSGPWQNYKAQAPQPDMAPWNSYVQKNLADSKATAADQASSAPHNPNPPQHPAQGILDAMKSGWQMSVSGLLANKTMPDTVLPENAGMAMRIASQAGQLAGDIPAMVAGGVMGGAVGTAVGTAAAPGPGTVVGAGTGAAMGAWGLPAAMRKTYVDMIQKGSISSFGDLFERASGALWEGEKAATVGAATEGAGNIAGGFATSGLAKSAAELATMTTMGKAMDGQVPKPQDFVDGALLLAGMHGSISVASEMPGYAKNVQTKLENIYADTGVKPSDTVIEAQTNPVLRQQMLSDSSETPKSYELQVEPPQPNQELISPSKNLVDAKIPPSLAEPHPTLGEGFAPESSIQVEKQPKDTAPEVSQILTPQEEVHARIGEDAPKEKMSASDLYTQVFDSLNPVKQLVKRLSNGGDVPAEQDPYVLFRTLGSDGKADAAIKFGPRDVDGEKTGTPSLFDIAKESKDSQGLMDYGIAAHSLELEKDGVKTGVPQEAAQKFVDDGKAQYAKPLKDLVDFQNDRLAYLRDSGVISSELHDESVQKWESYVPFNRVTEDGVSGTGVSSSSPIKAIHGSDLLLRDPMESIIRNTFAYTKIADENRAKLALVDLAQKSEEGRGLIQKVSADMRPIEVSKAEVQNFMKNNSIEGDPASFDIFRPMAKTLAKDEIAVMRDGKREVYNVGEDLKQAIDADPYNAPAVMKMASIPTKMLRIGAVDTVDFLAKHLTRDMANSFIYSENGIKPILSSLWGLGQYFSKSEIYKDWYASGAAMSNFTEIHRDYLQNDIYNLSKQTGLIDKTTNLAKNPLELFRAGLGMMKYLADGVVSAPRIAEYALGREAGKGRIESAFNSREVTIDNQRSGASNSIAAVSMLHAFWNTRIQGMDRLVRAFQDDPVQTAQRYLISTTFPALALWWLNKDDDRYKNANQAEKDLNYFIPTKDAMIRVPKAFEGGLLFGSMPERMMDGLYRKSPDAFKNFPSLLAEAAIPNPFMIDAAKPMIEQFANRSMLNGGNIVPHSLENVAPAYQYNPYTTETAKMLGKMISFVPGVRDFGHGNVTLASPLVIQNYVKAWSGTMGQYALGLADKALETAGVTTPQVQPASTLADIPIIKSFIVRYPSAGAQPIQDFYDNFQKTQTTLDTIQKLGKSGDIKALSSYANSPEAKESMVNLTGIEKALSAQNQMIQRIYANPQITPDAKRQQIDGVYYQMIQVSKSGNQMLQAVKEAAGKNF